MAAVNNEFTHADGVSLKTYMDTRFNALEDKIEAVEKIHAVMTASVTEATTLARIGMEHRLESMNEFREQLKEQASRFVTRSEMEVQKQILEAAVAEVKTGKVSWAVAISITFFTSLSLSLIVLVLTKVVK